MQSHSYNLIIYRSVYYINFLFSHVTVSFYFTFIVKFLFVNFCTNNRIWIWIWYSGVPVAAVRDLGVYLDAALCPRHRHGSLVKVSFITQTRCSAAVSEKASSISVTVRVMIRDRVWVRVWIRPTLTFWPGPGIGCVLGTWNCLRTRIWIWTLTLTSTMILALPWTLFRPWPDLDSGLDIDSDPTRIHWLCPWAWPWPWLWPWTWPRSGPKRWIRTPIWTLTFSSTSTSIRTWMRSSTLTQLSRALYNKVA